MKTSLAAFESTEAALSHYARTRDPGLRDQIIERHEALVRSFAHKFARPGVPVEDLIQSGWIALIGAVDRFDPAHGTRFSTYAVHCVVGEIRRYFRDKTWGIKVPRELQEIAAGLPLMQERLIQQLQRSPSVGEMAEAFGVAEETLLQAMELAHTYLLRGLEERREMGDDGGSTALGDTVGALDAAIEGVIEHAPLEAALGTLEEREQRIIRLRFFDGWSQTQVGAELGLSQMHISRLERKALQELRGALVAS